MKTRDDLWTHEQDLLLAETVLRHIRTGSTQLQAFEEVGDKLNRSASGCGFRWNAAVRHKYNEAILFAKKQRYGKKERYNRKSGKKSVEVQEVTKQLEAVIVEEIPSEKEKTEILNALCEMLMDCNDRPKTIQNIQRVMKFVLSN